MSGFAPSNAFLPQRVLTLAPMPPEKLAYALARYSRSPDSIRDSLDWVKTHDSAKFLDSFYFQYGHASIADLGHLAICFEHISELAATEIEDEQLWDGQARSSRYQDFAKSNVIVPPELTPAEINLYQAAADRLLDAYKQVHDLALTWLTKQLPCPEGMKPDAYRRNLTARAFDVARYLLPMGIPTGVGQVTNIRTLERQVRRLKASEYQELRELADELVQACTKPPSSGLDRDSMGKEAIAPTLAKYVNADEFAPRLRADLAEWAKDHLLHEAPAHQETAVELVEPADQIADICATLLYGVSTCSYRKIYELACSWPEERRNDVIATALGGRQRKDELPRHFRSSPFVFDIVMDIGAYRDLHRHRRCHQFRQAYTAQLGFEVPEAARQCGAAPIMEQAYENAKLIAAQLPHPAADYLLPFGTRSRFLFKMDFAELEYLVKLRSGVKGHFSYRNVAWQMKLAVDRAKPSLGALIDATPPWIEDPLTR